MWSELFKVRQVLVQSQLGSRPLTCQSYLTCLAFLLSIVFFSTSLDYYYSDCSSEALTQCCVNPGIWEVRESRGQDRTCFQGSQIKKRAKLPGSWVSILYKGGVGQSYQWFTTIIWVRKREVRMETRRNKRSWFWRQWTLWSRETSIHLLVFQNIHLWANSLWQLQNIGHPSTGRLLR